MILSLPDLWTVSSSGSGNGYQSLFTTRLSMRGCEWFCPKHQQLIWWLRSSCALRAPYLSLSRKTVWSILLPPFLQMIIRKTWMKEAARSNRNSSCVCVFQNDNVISILIDCFSIDSKTALKHYKQNNLPHHSPLVSACNPPRVFRSLHCLLDIVQNH